MGKVMKWVKDSKKNLTSSKNCLCHHSVSAKKKKIVFTEVSQEEIDNNAIKAYLNAAI